MTEPQPHLPLAITHASSLPVRSQKGHVPPSSAIVSQGHPGTVWKHRSPGARNFSGGLEEVEKVVFGPVNL